MQLKSLPIAALGAFLATINANSIANEHARKEALSLLKQSRQPRRNHGTFEEFGDDDYKRECEEEICDREELNEIFEDVAVQEQKWKELTDQCTVTQCDAEGTAKCIQRWKSRSCICKVHEDGIETVKDVSRFTGEDCEKDVDECADKANLTKCGDKGCRNTHGGFECGCPIGEEEVVAGNGTFTCQDIDECSNGTHNCGENAKCQNLEGSFTCECDAGFHADPENVDTVNCLDDDECEDLTNECNTSVGLSKKCVNNPGSYTCVCSEDGYTSADSEGTCEDIDECETECNEPAENCLNTQGSFVCDCDVGYSRINGTCTDNDECLTDITCGECNCVNFPGSFDCAGTETHNYENGVCTLKDPCSDVICPGANTECISGECICTKGEGYKQTPGLLGNCEDINECDSEQACGAEQNCVNNDGSFECIDVQAVAAPTFAPTTTEAPAAAPTSAPSVCGKGFEHDGFECVDIDECQDNNGNCPAMCINLYGDFMCYEEFADEKPLCHHFTTDDASNDYGYTCGCYEGYELCEDGFTCTCTGNRYVAESDGLECGSCGFDYDGSCYQQSTVKQTFPNAEADCSSRGGSLLSLNTRKSWWNIGSQVHDGRAAFWIGASSSENSANMYVVGDDAGEYVANSVENMAHVPPQWNKEAAFKLNHYVCEFPAGRVAKEACDNQPSAPVVSGDDSGNDVVAPTTPEATTEVNTTEAEEVATEEAVTEEVNTEVPTAEPTETASAVGRITTSAGEHGSGAVTEDYY